MSEHNTNSITHIRSFALKCLARQYSVGRQGIIQRAGACKWMHRASLRVWLLVLLYWQVLFTFVVFRFVLLITHSQARFLLTHDAELTATEAETKKDFDFYLECLYKSSPWAISVMEFFNRKFSTPKWHYQMHPHPLYLLPPSPAPERMTYWRNWTLPVSCTSLPTHLSALSVAPTTIQDDRIVVSTSMSISQSCAIASASVQLQVGVGQLSLSGRDSSTV